MDKKMLFVSLCGLVLIIAAVLTQSFVRRNQADRILTQVKESVAEAGNNPKTVAVTVYGNKNDIEFLQTHQPIINLRPQQSGAQESDYCEQIWYTFLHPQEGLDIINETFGTNFGGAADQMWFAGMMLRFASANGCAL